MIASGFAARLICSCSSSFSASRSGALSWMKSASATQASIVETKRSRAGRRPAQGRRARARATRSRRSRAAAPPRPVPGPIRPRRDRARAREIHPLPITPVPMAANVLMSVFTAMSTHPSNQGKSVGGRACVPPRHVNQSGKTHANSAIARRSSGRAARRQAELAAAFRRRQHAGTEPFDDLRARSTSVPLVACTPRSSQMLSSRPTARGRRAASPARPSASHAADPEAGPVRPAAGCRPSPSSCRYRPARPTECRGTAGTAADRRAALPSATLREPQVARVKISSSGFTPSSWMRLRRRVAARVSTRRCSRRHRNSACRSRACRSRATSPRRARAA